MSDLLLDERIMYWVFFPIIYVTLAISLFRFYYSLYNAYTHQKQPIKLKSRYQDHKDKQIVTKCDILAKRYSFLTQQAFNCRRSFLCKSQTGYLQKIGDRQPVDMTNNMMKMQSSMMQGFKGSMSMLLTNIPAMAWINSFFAGFILAKVPFSLTQKFRSMTQSGVDMENLDVRYVSGVSFYFLILFGLGQINSLFLKDDPQDQKDGKTPSMAMGPPNPAANPMMNQPNSQQNKQIFKPQIDSLQLINHHFALKDCPKHALKRLKHILQ